ncbi:macrosialin [Carettochelys insculpta]|uniref:macrosialin n=1 Tax=Carettochelys insculpta TaxID=44489 RepID=UPI003EBC848C
MGSLEALLIFLAVWSCTLAGDVAQELTPRREAGRQGPTPHTELEASCVGPGCPRPKTSATLEPAFTKSTPATTTHRTRHPTTTHRTTTHPANHTTPHHTTTHPANHSTSHPTTPPTTTHPANHSTSHPTTPHHTTTHPANHSTSHPTTPHHTTTHPANHSTSHPTTPHHTTVSPTAPPDVRVGDYWLAEGKEVCVRVQSGLEIRVEYTKSSKAKLWGAFAIQPNQTKVSGHCGNETATLRLNFPQGFLSFTFTQNKTRRTFYLREVQANLSLRFPGAQEWDFGAHNDSLQEFEARLGHSYQCQNRSMGLSPQLRLDALQERVQAFALPPSGNFGEAELCPAQRSLVVPIVIGVVLLVLILLVLIAYLMGRHRARGGYQTI